MSNLTAVHVSSVLKRGKFTLANADRSRKNPRTAANYSSDYGVVVEQVDTLTVRIYPVGFYSASPGPGRFLAIPREGVNIKDMYARIVGLIDGTDTHGSASQEEIDHATDIDSVFRRFYFEGLFDFLKNTGFGIIVKADGLYLTKN